MTDIEHVGNLIEAALWGVVASLCAVRCLAAEGSLRRVWGGLAVTFFFFGISDLIESQTGAWWRPPWLLLWKGLCVAFIVVGFWRYYVITKQASSPGDSRDPRQE